MHCAHRDCRNNVLMDGFCVRHLKQQCCICFNRVPSTNSCAHKRLSCGHAFHFRCIVRWFELSEECPVCRKPQPNDDVVQFRHRVEENMRKKYRDAMRSYEHEIRRLRRSSQRE